MRYREEKPVFLFIAFLTMAPAAVLPGFTKVESTPRADYYILSEMKLNVKPGRCEKFMEYAERRLQTRTPRFSYYRVKTIYDVAQYSDFGAVAGGIADPRANMIVSTEACSRHEVVHMVMFSIGRMDKVFEEGVASMLAGDYTDFQRRRQIKLAQGLGYRQIVRSFVRPVKSTDDLWMEYLVSDAWVRHLVDRYGTAKLAEFLKEHATLNAHIAFEKVYERDLDATFNSWLNEENRPSRW